MSWIPLDIVKIVLLTALSAIAGAGLAYLFAYLVVASSNYKDIAFAMWSGQNVIRGGGIIPALAGAIIGASTAGIHLTIREMKRAE